MELVEDGEKFKGKARSAIIQHLNFKSTFQVTTSVKAETDQTVYIILASNDFLWH